ncbi:MAG: OmpA family protein [Phycisphaerales bacterium]|nr:OmpA family protein [Phycisphaerales bacterium]
MSRDKEVLALLSGMLLMSASGCCLCDMFKQPTVEAAPPMVEAPPSFHYVEPAPPPPPPVVIETVEPAPPPELPPAVVKSIQELSDRYPDLFKFDKSKNLLYFNTDAMFDSGSAVVKPDAKAALGRLSVILGEEEALDRKLTIIGHTDSDRVVKSSTINTLKQLGKSADNMGLSEARAEAVAAILLAGGIDASRMTTLGKGDASPVADNRTPAGKARNRRVEIYVTPMDSGW